MWESNGSSIMSDDVWNLSLTNFLLDNFAELESSFLSVNSVWDESTLDIVEDSEMFVGLLDGDNVHLTEWESWISSDLSVNLNKSFFVSNDLD